MQNSKQKNSIVSCLKELSYRYRHAWILSYGIIYLAWFAYLEQTVTKKFHIITMPVDVKIPFCEYFIIPYMLWFAYVLCTVAYFFFYSTNDYYRLCMFLFTGMTIFLVVSTVYPNGHNLRPEVFARENWYTEIVGWLYETDTPTNLFPSIHVYNSLGTHIAIMRSSSLKNKKLLRVSSFVLCLLIILSTMFLKQHSVFDVLTACGLSAVMYYVIYGEAYKKVPATVRLHKRKKEQALEGLRLRM